eukprot:11755611-Alexandrium_andersonii.AAC.1
MAVAPSALPVRQRPFGPRCCRDFSGAPVPRSGCRLLRFLRPLRGLSSLPSSRMSCPRAPMRVGLLPAADEVRPCAAKIARSCVCVRACV